MKRRRSNAIIFNSAVLIMVLAVVMMRNYQVKAKEVEKKENELQALAEMQRNCNEDMNMRGTLLLRRNGLRISTLTDQIKNSFYAVKINEKIFKRIEGKSYKEGCDIPLKNLRLIKVLYYGFDGETHKGELIVNTKIADKVISIFKELYEIQYPIEKIKLVDAYGADDEKSMAANNTSCFNYRKIDGSKTLSKHSQGLAIDINPLYNPYIRTGKGKRNVLPVEGKKYADRSLDCPYYVKKGDSIYKIFKKYGFTWGGEWKNSKDYQHFEIKIN